MTTRKSEPPFLDLRRFYKPHALQLAMHLVDAKVKTAEIGRRWGKSRWAFGELLKAYMRALQTPISKDVTPPFHAWIVVPTNPQGRQTWTELLEFFPRELILEDNNGTVIGIHQAEQVIDVKGSELRPWGRIEMKSAFDPDSLQTVGVDFLWINEAQDISEKAFEKLVPILRSPERLGLAVYEGIPPLYPDHWFHRAFLAGQRGVKGYASFHHTTFENPLLTAAQLQEIEDDRELLPDAVWRRMYLAELSDRAGYFTGLDACIAGDLLPGPVPGVEYVAGIDLGRKVDASVLIIMDARNRKVVFHRRWMSGEDWILQREGMAHLCGPDEWAVSRMVVDATGMGGDIFSQELQSMGLPVEEFIITRLNRDPLLQTLAVAIERKTVQFPPVPELLRELRSFQHRKGWYGTVRIEAAPGEHDDEVFALALCLSACNAAQDVGGSSRAGSFRYLPTQEEAVTGVGNHNGARLMRDMMLARARERQERAGIA